jgi:adenosylhomocysteine nucleosidase
LTCQPTSPLHAQLPYAQSQVKPVALFAATRWELAALRRALPVDRQEDIGGVRCLIGERDGQAYWLIRTGVGPEAAKAAASVVLSRQPMVLAISTGFAGALMPVAIGDLIIGTSASSAAYDGSWKAGADAVICDRVVQSFVQSVAAEVGLAAQIGSIVSVSEIVYRGEDKQTLGRLTGAAALDMESAALALVAHQRAVPFMVVRTVSDLVGEDLPLDFNLFLRPSGWLSGIKELIKRPSSLVGLNRLRQQSRLAADNLTTVCSALAARGFGLSHET